MRRKAARTAVRKWSAPVVAVSNTCRQRRCGSEAPVARSEDEGAAPATILLAPGCAGQGDGWMARRMCAPRDTYVRVALHIGNRADILDFRAPKPTGKIASKGGSGSPSLPTDGPLDGLMGNVTHGLRSRGEAEHGEDACAQHSLVHDHLTRGHGLPRNPADMAEVMRLLRTAADSGNADAQTQLGMLLQAGEGVEQNFSEAASLFRAAAERGHAEGQCQLGMCLQAGKGVPQSQREAAHFYRRAAAQGHPIAQCNLGVIYHDGLGGEPQDYAEAARLFYAAAAQGLPCAQHNLGWAYWRGEGVPRDPAMAAHLFQCAASQGNMDAQSNLGVCYFHGQGVPRDCAKAALLFRAAAEEGHADAAFNLAQCYSRTGG